MPLARKHGTGLILASVFGMGRLTGRRARPRPPSRGPAPCGSGARQREVDIKHLAMQFCLDAPVDGIVMSGPADRHQLQDAYDAATQGGASRDLVRLQGTVRRRDLTPPSAGRHARTHGGSQAPEVPLPCTAAPLAPRPLLPRHFMKRILLSSALLLFTPFRRVRGRAEGHGARRRGPENPCPPPTCTWRTGGSGAPPRAPAGSSRSAASPAGSDTLVASFIGYEGVPPRRGRDDRWRRAARRAGARGLSRPGDRRRSRPGQAAGDTGSPSRMFPRRRWSAGSRLPGDLPLILDDTPGVLRHRPGRRVPGDSRINLRGFDQRNVRRDDQRRAPSTTWRTAGSTGSNFDGLGDATSVDPGAARAGGPRTLAIASVGGTVKHHHRHPPGRGGADSGSGRRSGSGAFHKTRGRLLLRADRRPHRSLPFGVTRKTGGRASPTRRGRTAAGPTSGP